MKNNGNTDLFKLSSQNDGHLGVVGEVPLQMGIGCVLTSEQHTFAQLVHDHTTIGRVLYLQSSNEPLGPVGDVCETSDTGPAIYIPSVACRLLKVMDHSHRELYV